MTKHLIDVLLGFAVKADKLCYGLDNIFEDRKKKYLIVICGSLSENSQKQIKIFAHKLNLPLIISKEKLDDILFKKNCKAVALRDKQMTQAILKNLDEKYQLSALEDKN